MATLVAALKKCGLSRDISTGSELHSQASAAGLLSNKVVATALITMYGKCGRMSEARQIFASLQSRDIICWNSLITGYLQNNQPDLALETFEWLPPCFADSTTYLAGVSACTSLAELNRNDLDHWLSRGERIISEASKRLVCSERLSSAMISLYCKCRRLANARGVFDGMKQRSVVVWTSLLQGYVENGESEVALQLFDEFLKPENGCLCSPDARIYVIALSACSTLASDDGEQLVNQKTKRSMLEKGKSIHSHAELHGCVNLYVENKLIDFYSKCGKLDLAAEVFDEMASRRDVVSWTSFISGCVQNWENELALRLFFSMSPAGVPENKLTFIAALAACGNLMLLGTGRALHAQILKRGLEQELILANTLVDFYSRCGRMDCANRVFDSIKTNETSTVSWTSLLYGFSLRGEAEKVLELYDRMLEEGVEANEITFACVLSACSHAGMSSRAKEVFKGLREELRGSKINVVHYGCMVDLLGRGSCLAEAVKVAKEMGNVVVWRALLAASVKAGDEQVSSVACEALVKLGMALDPGLLVMLASFQERRPQT